MADRRRIAHDLVLRAGTRFAASLLQAGTFFVLARALGPTDFGRLALLISVASVVSSVLALGIPVSSLRLLAARDPRASALTSVLLLSGTAAGSALMAVTLGTWMGFPAGISAAAAVAVFGEGSNDAAQWVFTGLERHRTASAMMLIRRVLVVAPTATAAMSGTAVLPAFILGSAMITAVPAFAVLLLRGPATGGGAVLRESRRYWPLSVLTALWSLDIAATSVAVGHHASGLYAVSARLSGPLALVIQSIFAIVTPRLVAADTTARASIDRAVGRLVHVYAALLVALSPLLAWVTIRLLGSAYSAAWPILVAVCIASAVSVLAQRRLALLIAGDEPRVANWSVGIGVVVGLLSIFLLGSLLDIVGLAIAVVLAQMSVLTCLMVLPKRSRTA